RRPLRLVIFTDAFPVGPCDIERDSAGPASVLRGYGRRALDLNFSAAEIAFRDEVRAFLDASLPERLRVGARATPVVFAEPDIAREWQKILRDKGWLAYHWAEEH